MAEEIYGATLKREIKNIIKSYTGWFDPLSELIQNALDAVDERTRQEKGYVPRVWIEINLGDDYVCVTDNGIGFSEEQFATFLKPNVSFKGGGTRGDKGVGATYLAYGFNFLQIGTKGPGFSYVGNLEGGRAWVEDAKNVLPRPKVNASRPIHKAFDKIDRGSTFCLKFIGDYIRPSDLTWFGAETSKQWETILRIKTPLGGIYLDREIPKTTCTLCVIDSSGRTQQEEIQRCEYIYPHNAIPTCVDLGEIIEKQRTLTARGRPVSRLPDNLYQLNGIHSCWNYKDILSKDGMLHPQLKEEEKELLEKCRVHAYGFLTYSTDVWDEYSDSIVGLRKSMRILKGGLQLACNGMPQGELVLIPLTRNIGYQHNSHVVIHFDRADPDLGRKGFQPELVDLAEKIAVSIVGLFLDWRHHLRTTTGAPRQITQSRELYDWVKETEEHEREFPLVVKRQDVFLPTKEIRLTATPVVEQDVVVLFNQLLAGGVIRGIKLLSASTYKTYDGLWRACLKKPFEHYSFDKNSNPLGIEQVKLQEYESPPWVLEYKYNFDALLEEIEQGDKTQSDIKLVVCWEMGNEWKRKYDVTPLLHLSNLHHREIHGITHCVRDSTTGQDVFMVVALKELIDYVNEPDEVQEYQKRTYMKE